MITIENLYKLAKSTEDIIGKDTKSEVIIYLTKDDHEELQQEVFNFIAKTLINYKSNNVFEICIYNIKYIIKISK